MVTSLSSDTARFPRVLRGAAASHALVLELPTEVRVRTRDITEERDAQLRAGFEAGYAEGLQAGHLQAAADGAVLAGQVGSLLAALGRAAQALETCTTAELGAVEDAIVAGALELAEAILGREVDQDRAATDAVARALALAPANVDIAVHVNPADAEIIEATGLPGNVKLVADPAVIQGGCMARVGDCTIDARLGAALERAKEALR